ncbi:hypothetical protein V6N13_061109 [Hibiscus sabdariffa]
MVPGTNRWDERKVDQIFIDRDKQSILNCPIARTLEDKVIWDHHPRGMYTTRSCHQRLLDREEERSSVSAIWKDMAKLQVMETGCVGCAKNVQNRYYMQSGSAQGLKSSAMECLESEKSLDAQYSTHSGTISLCICPGRER